MEKTSCEKEKITAVILAAGKGTRMQTSGNSEIPKVMYELCGKPLLWYSIKNIKEAGIENIIVVDGYKKEKVEDYFKKSVQYAVQDEQLGTGHAAMMALPVVNDTTEAILICYGDMPLYKSKTIKKLIGEFLERKPTIAMLSVHFDEPNQWSYGRIKKDEKGNVIGIVEQKDCTEEEKSIKECNPGFYIFDVAWFKENIEKLRSENAQHEYYLTDMIQIAKEQDKTIISIAVERETEALGVNTPEQLKIAEEVLNNELKK